MLQRGRENPGLESGLLVLISRPAPNLRLDRLQGTPVSRAYIQRAVVERAIPPCPLAVRASSLIPSDESHLGFSNPIDREVGVPDFCRTAV
jgi:hypothetical protein